MTPRQVQRKLKMIRRKLDSGIAEAELKTITWALAKAVRYSSGTFRARGHYSKQRPRKHPDPSIINVQSRRFRASWNGYQQRGGYVILSVLENTAPYSKWMKKIPSRRLMIDRPILERVAQMLPEVRQRNLRTAIRRALKP